MRAFEHESKCSDQPRRGSTRRATAIICLVLFLILGAAAAWAQNLGQIAGTVTDSTGAVVLGAQVKITNVATQQVRTTVTNEAGEYRFPFLVPGEYEISAEQSGFKTAVRSGFQLHVGDSGRADFALDVGQVTQSTQVVATTPLLTTENTAVGTVIENRRIVELPLNGRNYYQLIALSPNVTAEMAGPGFALGRQGGDRTQTVFSVAGQHLEFNRFLLDGAENTDVNWNTFMIRPSVEALQEFKVQTGIYSVEFGRAVTQISVITKPGGNQFHGTAFEFLRNSNLDAREFLNSNRKNPFRRNQFGYVASGRILKDKLFFMSNIEWTRDRQAFLQTATVPTVAMRGGDFSGYSKVLYDPNTRVYGTDAAGNVKALSASPFTNNTIPTTRFDATAQRLLKYYPSATLPGTANNYQRDAGRPINYASFTNRIDYNESAKSNWFGRYSFSDELYGGTSVFPNQQTNTTTKVYQIMVSNTRTFGTTVVNESRFCYGFFHNEDASVNAYTNNVMADLAIPGSLELGPATWRVPSVGIQSFNGFGDGSGGPFINKNHVFQWMDNLSIVRGRHSLKFGGELRRDRFNQLGNSYIAPYLTFSTTFTRDPNNLANTGLSFGDMLLGWLTSGGRAMAPANRQYRSSGMFGYAEDVWTVKPGLTVTLGIRYENVRPWTDKYDAQMNLYFPKNTGLYDPTNVPILTRPGTGNFWRGASVRYADNIPTQVGDQYMGKGLIWPDNNNFAPRVGIAWSPTNKWSLRVGAGLFYSQDIANAAWDIGRNIAGRQDVFANAEKPDAPISNPWTAVSTSSACSNYNGPFWNLRIAAGYVCQLLRPPDALHLPVHPQRPAPVDREPRPRVGLHGQPGPQARTAHQYQRPRLSNRRQRHPDGSTAALLVRLWSAAGSRQPGEFQLQRLQRQADPALFQGLDLPHWIHLRQVD